MIRRAFVGTTLALGMLLTLFVGLALGQAAEDSQNPLLSRLQPLLVHIEQSIPLSVTVWIPTSETETMTVTVPAVVELSLDLRLVDSVPAPIVVVSPTFSTISTTDSAAVSVTALPTEQPKKVFGSIEVSDPRLSPLVAGNAAPDLPPGNPDEISIIATADPRGSLGTTIALILRNNSAEAVRRIELAAVAYAADGSLLAVGDGDAYDPVIVEPGGIAFGSVYFSDTELPKDARVEYEVSSEAVEGSYSESIRDLEVLDVNRIQNRLVGFLHNQYEETVTGPIGVQAHCFNDDGTYLRSHSDFTSQDEVESGEKIPYQVSVDDSCSVYLVTASGYSFDW